MLKFALLMIVTGGGCLGALVRGPYVPLAVYVFYTVFRPQFLWKWELVAYPDIGWSRYVALAALLAYVPWALGVIGSPNDPTRRIQPSFVLAHRLMLAFGVWATVSFAFALDTNRAWLYYQELLKIFAMYLLATQVLRTAKQIWGLYLVMTLAIGYIAVDVNHLYLTTGYLLLYRQGYAGLDNNGAALMLAMGIPLCYFAWERTQGWYRWGFLAVIPFIIHAVVSSYSRGAMLSALVIVPLYFFYSRKRRLLTIAVVGVAIMMPFLAGKEIQERFFSVTKAETDESFNSRQDSWMAAIRIANDYPIFGAGVRCSNLLTYRYGADMQGRTIHSQYLQIAADDGWPGMLLYLATIGMTFVSMWRARRRLWKCPDPEAVRAVAMLGGIECALWTFVIGAAALSLETFEMSYIVILLGAQMWAIVNARVAPPPGMRRASAQSARQPEPLPSTTGRFPARPTMPDINLPSNGW